MFWIKISLAQINTAIETISFQNVVMDTLITEFSRPNKSVPWGFSIQGGKEFGSPLAVLKVTPGSIADRLGVIMGDLILNINEIPSDTLTHQQAILQIQNLKVTLEIKRPKKADFPPPPPSVNSVNFNNSCRDPSMSGEFPPPPPPELSRPKPPGDTLPLPPPKQLLQSNTAETKTRLDFSKQGFTPATNNPNSKSQTVPTVVLDPKKMELFQKQSGQDNGRSQGSLSSNFGKFNQNQPNNQYRDSRDLVAQQSNQDKSSSICFVCKDQIKSGYIEANGKRYCNNHFCCSYCRQPIKSNQFIETKEGTLYCMDDFKNNIAPRCAKCNDSVIEEQIMAMGKCWHSHCFLCDHCKRPIPQGQFHVKEDNGLTSVYCEKDYKDHYEIKCAACNFPIDNDDKYLLVSGKNYHVGCYKR